MTEVWAVARSLGGNTYALEDPVDSSTADAVGTSIDLPQAEMKKIVTKMKDVSGVDLLYFLIIVKSFTVS